MKVLVFFIVLLGCNTSYSALSEKLVCGSNLSSIVNFAPSILETKQISPKVALKSFIESRYRLLGQNVYDQGYLVLKEPDYIRIRSETLVDRLGSFEDEIECFANALMLGDQTLYYFSDVDGVREEGFLVYKKRKLVAVVVEYFESRDEVTDYIHEWGALN